MKKNYTNIFVNVILTSALSLISLLSNAQTAYYIDGYHGGIWGHYPDWNTRFMADMLRKNPNWKINIELEPETWARAKQIDPAAYADFKTLFADQSLNGCIEYVNPAYAQSYMWDISGESIIRQFQYGMKMVREHFPEAAFTSYSSEEPCFTSALPGILTSLGIKYASLKNPNTCWGGYTQSHTGELVNWIGPDGSSLITSPRYTTEKLSPKSTWQTIAWNNALSYINTSFSAGMPHPVGMTLQDAGWTQGPFIGTGQHGNLTSIYTTWRNYFGNIAKGDKREDWRVSQEDMLVSLVWGSQVMQHIAQEVRVSENKLVTAEKMAAMARIYAGAPWPQAQLDSAWRTLMLSQHHDCWIVPYNGKKGDTWADKVVTWTNNTNTICNDIITRSEAALAKINSDGQWITVHNPTSKTRIETVRFMQKNAKAGQTYSIYDSKGKPVASQVQSTAGGDSTTYIFTAEVPAMAYAAYRLAGQSAIPLGAQSPIVKQQSDGKYLVETDQYKIIIDPAHGGVIKSIVAKKLGNREFIDQSNARAFNELRGNFYNNGGFRSSADSAARIEVIENGPLQVKLAVKGKIARQDFTQVLTLAQGSPLIDVQLNINWKGNPGIGRVTPPNTYRLDNPEKAFYDDRYKLLALFPLNLQQQKVYKNAPFDVTESRLKNTFFTRWDSIKNNVILNWVDVTDGAGKYGMALFTDHTTSYTHGEDFPLGLNIQYSGMGLWNRNHTINGPTNIHYALLPHAGKWDQAGVEAASVNWNQPLLVSASDKQPVSIIKPLISVPDGYEISSVTFNGNDMLVRLFNTGAGNVKSKIIFNCKADKALLTELDGRTREMLPLVNQTGRQLAVYVTMPKFGFRTIRLTNAKLI